MKRKESAVLTIDVEEWFHGVSLDKNAWGTLERRAHKQIKNLLLLLSNKNYYATFFIVGDFARSNKELVKEISQAGHEVGSHSMFHDSLLRVDRKEFEFQESSCKAIIEELIGKRVYGFRAPYFSINESNMWVYEVLSELKYSYSSSLSPVKTWRYGVKGLKPGVYEFAGVKEVTPSFGELMGIRYGLGGAYFRLLPFAFTRYGVEDKLKKEIDTPVSFFIHPWEFDPDHPRVDLPTRARFTHYFNLNSTEGKFNKLIEKFRFTSFEEWLRGNKTHLKDF